MNNDTFAQRIKELCSSRNITIKTLLEECSLNRNFIYDLKIGKSVSIDKVERIADYFNISIDYLIGRQIWIRPDINIVSQDMLEEIKKS